MSQCIFKYLAYLLLYSPLPPPAFFAFVLTSLLVVMAAIPDEPVVSGPFLLYDGSFVIEFLRPDVSRNATLVLLLQPLICILN